MKKVLLVLSLLCVKIIFAQTVLDSLSINPNPFQKRALCTYSFISNDTVSINVYNVNGTIIYSPITNSIMTSGIYQDSLIMDTYSDGVYFVHLKLGHRKTIAKKIIKSNTAGVISQSIKTSDINLYPNPTAGSITLDFGSPPTHHLNIQVRDCLGNLIKEEDIKIAEFNSKINLNLNYKAGVYFVTVKSSSNQSITKKLIVADKP